MSYSSNEVGTEFSRQCSNCSHSPEWWSEAQGDTGICPGPPVSKWPRRRDSSPSLSDSQSQAFTTARCLLCLCPRTNSSSVPAGGTPTLAPAGRRRKGRGEAMPKSLPVEPFLSQWPVSQLDFQRAGPCLLFVPWASNVYPQWPRANTQLMEMKWQ